MNSKTENTDKLELEGEWRWYLAASKSLQESRGVEQLKNQSIDAYCPTIKVEKIVRGKKQLQTEALFTSYIFITISKTSP